jgi:SAM-dependent methyltransferase
VTGSREPSAISGTRPGERSCPLCGDASAGRALSRTPYAEIWRNLEREWGARISDAVKAEHTPEAVVELRCCRGCDLHYFSPAVAGSERFYLELSSSSPGYYNETKWEFEYVRKLLRPHHRVLDVACGGGGFLRAIAGTVREAIGIDTNPALPPRPASPYLVFHRSIEDFSCSHRDQFDFVSAFQVIEHLDSVMPFVRASYIDALRHKELPALVPFRFRGRDTAFKVVSRLLLGFPMSLAWTRLAMPSRLGMFGMSMVIVLEKPRSPCAD